MYSEIYLRDVREVSEVCILQRLGFYVGMRGSRKGFNDIIYVYVQKIEEKVTSSICQHSLADVNRRP